MVPLILFSLLLITSAAGLPRSNETGKFPPEVPPTHLEWSSTEPTEIVPSFDSCGNSTYYSSLMKACVPYTDGYQNGVSNRGRVNRNAEIGSLNYLAFMETTNQTVCGTTNQTGIFCHNRTHVGVCIAEYSDTGAYSSRTLTYPCSGDTVCVSGTGCKSDNALLSRARPFFCTDDGRFPDQYNCTVYHDCSTSTTDPTGFSQTTGECADGQIYSIKRGVCTNVTEIATCSSGVYCHSDLEVGILIDDPNIYYVCHSEADYPGDLSPSFYTCSSAQQGFNPAALACVSATSNITWSELPSPTMF